MCVLGAGTAGQAAGYVHRRYTETAHELPCLALGLSIFRDRGDIPYDNRSPDSCRLMSDEISPESVLDEFVYQHEVTLPSE